MATRTGSRTQNGSRPRWLKTNWHPVQVQALTILTERVASPKQIAEKIGEPLVRNVSYHVRELEKAGLVELVFTKPRRGATEHFFKATVRPSYDSENWTKAEREEVSKLILQLFLHDVAIATEAETFDVEPERHMSRAPLCLDRQGWLDLVAEQDRLLDRSLEIQAESDERRTGSGEDGKRVTALMASFTMPSGQGSLDQSG